MYDIITRNEILNNGKTIHLYFNGMIGLYVAYGVSAFLLYKYANGKPSYSEDMQMPVAVINAEHFEELAIRLGMSKNVSGYRCLNTDLSVDMEKYEEWASKLRELG